MIDIGVTGLVKSFDLEKKILDGLTLQIDTGERVGILGRNGAGKTTFFKILTGELDYDSGEVFVAPGKRLGLISQIPVYPPEYTVEDVLRTAFSRMERLKGEMDALAEKMAAGDSSAATLKRYGDLSARFEGLGGWDTDTAVSKVANGLTIDDSMRSRLFSELSGGEKTRVNLGRLILEDTDILLLDEPTNHLDLQATVWLEEYISKFRGTVLTISHDRYFLDRTVYPHHRNCRRQGGVLQRKLQLLRRGKGAALSGAHEAVSQGAGQDPSAGKGRRSDAPVGLYGQRCPS